MLDAQGRWLPDLSPRGLELFNSRSRYTLVWGPRKTGKTLAILHTLCRHIYESPQTSVAIVAKTLKVGRIGPWGDLLNFIIPQWVAANIGFQVTKPESFMADTKMCYIRIRAADGGESQVELHSCEHPDEAESRFKSGRWSFIYISEADTFPEDKPFKVLGDQLRNPAMKFEDHHLIMDANPAEEGEEHWLFKLFFGSNGVKHPNAQYAALFREMRFDFSHNPFIAEAEIAELAAKYQSDPVEHARFVAGRWLADRSRYIFGEVFRPATHVIGSNLENGEMEYLVPNKSSWNLFSGWDLGDRNHACALFTARDSDSGLSIFDVIDEVVALKRDTALPDFVEAVLERMDFWESFMLKEYGTNKVAWRHWSDASAFRYRSAMDSNEELEVRRISNGRILLHAATKAPGSVRVRVNLVRKLLFENRLFFSSTCPHVVDSIAKLREGPSKAEFIRADDPRKHAFDALSYGLANESPMETSQSLTTRKKRVLPVLIAR
jgi:hypothetical protein